MFAVPQLSVSQSKQVRLAGHNIGIVGFSCAIPRSLGKAANLLDSQSCIVKDPHVIDTAGEEVTSRGTVPVLSYSPGLPAHVAHHGIEPLSPHGVSVFVEKTSDPDPGLVKYALDTLKRVGNVLTLFQDEKVVSDDKVLEQLRETASVFVTNVKGKGLEEIMDLLLQARETARAKKDWKTADSIRNELDKIGFEVQDTTDGPVWRKK